MKVYHVRLLLQFATFSLISFLVFIISSLFNSNRAVQFSILAPLVVYTLFLIIVKQKKKKIGHIPGPQVHFPDGNFLDMYWGQPNLMDGVLALAAAHGYPHVLCVWGGFIPQIVVITPEAITQVLSNMNNFSKGILFSVLRQIFGHALFSLEGDMWKRHRRTLNTSFRTENLKAFANNLFPKHAQHLIQKIKEKMGDKSSINVNIANLIYRLSMDIICEGAFGYEVNALSYSGESNKLFSGINYVVTNVAYALIPFANITPFYATMMGYKNNLYNIIHSITLQESKKVSLILDLMVNKEFSAEEINGETFGFLAAGYETTATLVIWILTNMSKHPAIQAKVVEEIDEVLQGKQPQWQDMERLPYTLAVIQETLRHDAPIIAVSREASIDTLVEDILVPKGSTVWVSPVAVQMNPNVWPNPNEFNPDRFLDNLSLTNAIFPAFGVGPRACIGRQFALHEATVILAVLMQSFTIAPYSACSQQERISIVRTIKRGDLSLTLVPREKK